MSDLPSELPESVSTPSPGRGDDAAPSSDSFAVTPPGISLPKGGGAVRGIGEKFSANPVTGTGSMTVPIAASPGRSGFGPQLSLSYDSGAGNGPFGFGWSLPLPSITRKTDKGLPQYQDADESDVFILSGAEDLVPVLAGRADGTWEREQVPPRTIDSKTYRIERYRPRIEGLFARIERWTNQKDPKDTFWRSISKDNITTWYGKTPESRIFDPADHTRIFSWLICESYDDKGNVIVYGYREENSDDIGLSQAHERNRTPETRAVNRYLKRIKYGNRTPYYPILAEDQPPTPLPSDWMFEVVFDYGEHDSDVPKAEETVRVWPRRDDPFSSYRAGFEVRTYRLCQRVLMFHHFPGEERVGNDCLVRSTDFTYSHEQDPTNVRNPIYTFLREVTQTGYKRDGDGYVKRSLPPVEFEYTQPVVQDRVEEVDPASLENLPIGVDGATYRWTDLHGEGIPGVLTEQADAWFYKRNVSPIGKHPVELAPLKRVAAKPNLALAGGAQFMDLAGDGQPDLVVLDGPTPGLYEHDGDEGWQPFRPFTSRLDRDTRDPNLKLLDLSGDGHADVLITEDDALVWHSSLAEEGFGPAHRVHQALDEEEGPRLVFADGTQSIYLADVSGDGLTDLVRIRNGEVCYWPNLGYGRFGAKVTMDHAPHFDHPDQFDHKRIRLADIDGTGTTDIIYLHRDGVRLYFNQSGNSWSEPQVLDVFPRVDDLAHIVPADLLGNGTACLVWSSPLPGDARRPMRYVNLMGGQKPHLLVKTVNNLGAETRVQYAPSTKFYLQDKYDGKPWITRLPFPVHVVERVETYDHVSRNRFVTRYAHHHGYFDGEEREFRGFGMVEQWDTEEYAALTASGSLAPAGGVGWGEAATNIDAASHVPPVLTKTWFHTGASLDQQHISTQHLDEYYNEGDESLGESDLSAEQLAAMRLPDTVRPDSILISTDERIPWSLSATEQRQAFRALKGSLLRQEVYALDGTEAEDRPYTVSERNYTVEMLQPQQPNQHAVFFTHARETVDFQYERELYKVERSRIVDRDAASAAALDLADPRVSHSMTLSVDEFGNVLQAVAIGYGRRHEFDNPSLEPEVLAEIRDKQRKTLLTYAENRYTQPVPEQDSYRTPLPCEARTYELRNVTAEASQPHVTNLFHLDEMARTVQEIADGGRDIPYADVQAAGAADGRPARRLVEQRRTLHRSNDLTRLLAPGELESMALPGESYQLALTPDLLDAVYRRGEEDLLPERDRAAVLAGKAGDQGGYVDLEGNGHWWIPSGRVFFHPAAEASATQELEEARGHFFQPRRFEDPFGNSAFVTRDAHDLLIAETRDALENRVSAVNDYRVLRPTLETDTNRNRSAVVFDALGLVVGTAVMGKASETLGDLIDDEFRTDLTESEVAEFFAEPKGPMAGTLLGAATTRIVYDLYSYRRSGAPTFAATLARETHVSEMAPDEDAKMQVSFSFSDGFGRVIQQKAQAEPGPVPKRDPETDRIIVDAHGQPVMTDEIVAPRWVGSGWTVFNNKGKPVRNYEPYFTDRHEFEFDVGIGVSPLLFYDPLGRVVATLHPKHTYDKLVFDPWQQATWDVNDTVLQADPATDADVGDFFVRLREDDYLPTWHELRSDTDMALERWPDVDPITGAVKPENEAIRQREAAAAQKAAEHAATPARVYFDTLGRPVLSVAHNRFEKGGIPVNEYHATRTDLDIEGKPLRIVDARGNAVMTYMTLDADERWITAYDLAGILLYQNSADAGERWKLGNVAGNPVRRWDSRGFQRRLEYDELQRPTHLWVQDANAVEWLAERTLYGELHPEAQALNMRGHVYQLYDGAGILTSEAYDFKGNLSRSQRAVASNYKTEVDWSDVDPFLQVPPGETLDLPAVEAAARPLLESEILESSTVYDALNRTIQQVTPHHVTTHDNPVLPNVIQPVYNEASLLNSIDVWLRRDTRPEGLLNPATAEQHPVTNTDYNAKGQRTRIAYGNDVVTDYTYDRETFRLVHLLTKQNLSNFPGDHPRDEWPGCHVQNLRYTYDPAGNITHIRDDAQQTIFFRNRRVEPSAEYTYDALYRLVRATGREHLGQNPSSGLNPPVMPNHTDAPRVRLDHPGDGQAMGNYAEWYEYDGAGNILAMRHQADSGGWARCYQYANDSNRLLSTGGRNDPHVSCPTPYDGRPVYREPYTYDAHGNMTSLPHLPMMAWDFKDQLQASTGQVRDDGGTPETTYYTYDATGKRVRKVTDAQASPGETPSRIKERIYLGDFEIFRAYDVDGTTIELERETLHVMDDQQRITLVETKTRDDREIIDDTTPLIRYQLINHLGSSSVELAEDADVISYEEYYPYGSTSYKAVRSDVQADVKRYRYTGMERDEETGLAFHMARYYAPRLARWCNADPVEKTDTFTHYVYAKDNPINYFDTNGREEQAPPQTQPEEPQQPQEPQQPNEGQQPQQRQQQPQQPQQPRQQGRSLAIYTQGDPRLIQGTNHGLSFNDLYEAAARSLVNNPDDAQTFENREQLIEFLRDQPDNSIRVLNFVGHGYDEGYFLAGSVPTAAEAAQGYEFMGGPDEVIRANDTEVISLLNTKLTDDAEVNFRACYTGRATGLLNQMPSGTRGTQGEHTVHYTPGRGGASNVIEFSTSHDPQRRVSGSDRSYLEVETGRMVLDDPTEGI
jgi:RHS repeat-associated protein